MATTQHIISTLPNTSPWVDALRDRRHFPSAPAVYALMLGERFPRLLGDSQVLYIGQTGQLGGDSDRSRLYGYRYPSGGHSRLIRSKAAQLLAIGHMITFHWAVVEDQDTSRRIEAALLQMHLDEHLEFPPFNGKS